MYPILQCHKGGIMESIKQMIHDHDSMIIIAHIRPDGDCIGATQGLAHSIRFQYPDKKVFVRYEAVDYLAFLGAPDDVSDETFTKSLVISLDTAHRDRIYDPRYNTGKALVRIDHHPHVDFFGDIDHVDTTSPSTCNIITQMLLDWGWHIPLSSAQALYTGITTDTGRFRYRGVTEQTLSQAASLVKAGVEPTTIYDQLYQRDLTQVHFLGTFLSQAQTAKGVIYVVLSQAEIMASGLSEDQAANFISHLSDIEGYPIWLLVYQTKEGMWRVRLRSSGIVINEVAARYHGGGHPQASGCQLSSIDQLPELIADLERLL
jgi:bifunctional oligoribonuclease and PAP phosphatase NrnA